MKHHKAKRTLGRDKDERNALLRSLAISLVEHGSIKTTEAKAKELRPYVEKLVTHGKKGTLAGRRLLESKIGKVSSKRLFDEISPKFKERNGGYTRIVKLPIRKTDAAKMAYIEFVD